MLDFSNVSISSRRILTKISYISRVSIERHQAHLSLFGDVIERLTTPLFCPSPPSVLIAKNMASHASKSIRSLGRVKVSVIGLQKLGDRARYTTGLSAKASSNIKGE